MFASPTHLAASTHQDARNVQLPARPSPVTAYNCVLQLDSAPILRMTGTSTRTVSDGRLQDCAPKSLAQWSDFVLLRATIAGLESAETVSY